MTIKNIFKGSKSDQANEYEITFDLSKYEKHINSLMADKNFKRYSQNLFVENKLLYEVEEKYQSFPYLLVHSVNGYSKFLKINFIKEDQFVDIYLYDELDQIVKRDRKLYKETIPFNEVLFVPVERSRFLENGEMETFIHNFLIIPIE